MKFTVLNTVSETYLDQLMDLYKTAWWSAKRKREDVRSMLTNSEVTVGLCEESSGKLIAFARALSDFTYKAMIYDVIVLPEHRGQGVGAALMEAVINHPVLKNIPHQDLYCLEKLIPFYNKWGFKILPEGNNLMRRSPGVVKA